jgi:hypothetical protein
LQKKAAKGRQRLQYAWEGDILKRVTRV